MEEKKNAESVFVGKAEGRRRLRRPWLGWGKILK
jgi:hypothetical protein